jgi:hypothetical protein
VNKAKKTVLVNKVRSEQSARRVSDFRHIAWENRSTSGFAPLDILEIKPLMLLFGMTLLSTSHNLTLVEPVSFYCGRADSK